MSDDTRIETALKEARKEIGLSKRYSSASLAFMTRESLEKLVDEIDRLRAELDRCERRHLGRATSDGQ